MPAKGRYFLNEGDEGPNQAALYEKYRLTSHHGPLLLLLLLVAVAICIALISITFSQEVRPQAVALWPLGSEGKTSAHWRLPGASFPSFANCSMGGKQVNLNLILKSGCV